MTLSRLDQIFSRWMPGAMPPGRPGWYHVRTDALEGAWWNGTAYFDGDTWWEYGSVEKGPVVRRELKVLQWRGLALEAKATAALLRANLPKTSAARRGWLKLAAILEIPASMAR